VLGARGIAPGPLCFAGCLQIGTVTEAGTGDYNLWLNCCMPPDLGEEALFLGGKQAWYVLAQHARDVLARRAIPVDWVGRAPAAPEAVESDRVDLGLEHRLIRIPVAGNRVLRVVVNRTSTPQRVVTAFLDRRVTL